MTPCECSIEDVEKKHVVTFMYLLLKTEVILRIFVLSTYKKNKPYMYFGHKNNVKTNSKID